MSKYLNRLIVILVISACLGSAGQIWGAEGVGLGNGAETGAQMQLRIYKDQLLNRAKEQSRTDAAVALLLRGDRAAREILLEALLLEDNAEARRAVCRGLIRSRGWGDVVEGRKEFLEPLVGMLIDEKGLGAELAAEALLIFKYREISGRLRELARSEELDTQIRLNVVYALKLWPDKEAISELVRLLDADDSEVAAAAGVALQNWIPVGTDREKWKDILRELQRKSPNEIIRDRLAFQESEMRRLEAERDRWRGLYLASLDKEYEGADETGRGALLVGKLGAEDAAVKIWALEKVSHRSALDLPEEFGTVLKELVKDDDRQVRLVTANVLSKMSGLNPAEKLLEQHAVEEYEDVRLAIFEALGEACFFAFSPGSEISLSIGIRDETLELAGGYVEAKDAEQARKGAEVVRKLLELNGFEKVQAAKYIKKVETRYAKARDEEGPLRGELLGVMAMLCGKSSYYRPEAARVFEKFFMEGLDLEGNNASIREASVTGLVNVGDVNKNSAAVLEMFKARGLEEDSSGTIQKVVIELAGDVGKAEDLAWLSEKIDSNGQGESAWHAMRKVLQGQEAMVVAEWAKTLGSGSSERGRVLLEMAEKKAEGENNTKILESVREALLDAYLDGNNAERVGQLMSRRLKRKKDLGHGDRFIMKIDAYLGSEADVEAKMGLLEILIGIKDEQGAKRGKWKKQLKIWHEKVASEAKKSQAQPEGAPAAETN